MVRMQDVAKKAGVSLTTVSFVLNQQKSIVPLSKKTREKVLQTAEELGYRRNEIARSMARGRTQLIGFFAPVLRFEYIGAILEGILEEAEKQNYFIKVSLVPELPAGLDVIRRSMGLRLSGLICSNFDTGLLEQIFAECANSQAPVVQVDNTLSPLGRVQVVSDDPMGMRLAVEHLAGLGHSRIGCISGQMTTSWGKCRAEGYRQAMAALRLRVPDDYLQHIDGYPEHTEGVVRKLLERADRPTAMVCASDLIAANVMGVACQLKLRIPQDLSVVGFADLLLAQNMNPALTTVAQPFAEMGQTAMRHLIRLIEFPKNPAPTEPIFERIPTRLVVRESTAPPQCHARSTTFSCKIGTS